MGDRRRLGFGLTTGTDPESALFFRPRRPHGFDCDDRGESSEKYR